ncbi:TIGR04282 family arsenosugar biosynthesis glycosyltransferase [Actinomadura sp. HBU206391]|uniref:TIGR04282 family arsenosugar biosynthesis glycosyltransferase n=1 Tax=Actinomadura sp. HBU206391 TaxID=2731692 RepID=UPI0016502649|nr:TIGR04282 family arsenosugar biosynthesis glycosyltransferase [Actinomadura sp. HBU206391]MBC6461193.1 TIGR04282 family arsenosugar biosynthesis glycosyltransferase [Actinomadura sp. HBU206391]
MTQILVIAKEPRPGRVKTRLCPPFTPGQCAQLAAAALQDTLRAVTATPVRHRVLVLDGHLGDWPLDGFTVIPQRGGGLDQRLAAAFTDAHRLHPVPTVLIGMDTPQVAPALLWTALTALSDHDAVFGPAADGGFWLLGLRRPEPDLLLGVPMSTAHTGAAQLHRLSEAGLTVATLPRLTDVDTAADAYQVAAEAPGSLFATALRAMRVKARQGT